jgi:hypothetical protein
MGSVYALAIIISFLVQPASLEYKEISFYPKSAEHQCVFCGMTRSFCAISHGNFNKAVLYNRHGPVVYAFFAVLACYAISQLAIICLAWIASAVSILVSRFPTNHN